MADPSITVFLVDDHPPIVEGLMALATTDPCLQVIGCCYDGLKAVDLVRAARPNVLVLDISLPGMNGLEVCRIVKKVVPATAVLMHSMHASEQCVLGAMATGASGYVTKDATAMELCAAVHTVWRGEVYLGQGVPASVADAFRGGCASEVKYERPRHHPIPGR